jgi:hypothetical protein
LPLFQQKIWKTNFELSRLDNEVPPDVTGVIAVQFLKWSLIEKQAINIQFLNFSLLDKLATNRDVI